MRESLLRTFFFHSFVSLFDNKMYRKSDFITARLSCFNGYIFLLSLINYGGEKGVSKLISCESYSIDLLQFLLKFFEFIQSSSGFFKKLRVPANYSWKLKYQGIRFKSLTNYRKSCLKN